MDSDKEVTRARQKITAYYRAKLRLKQRFDSVDFELDILKPKLKELEAGLTQGLLPEFTIEEEPKVKKNANRK